MRGRRRICVVRCRQTSQHTLETQAHQLAALKDKLIVAQWDLALSADRGEVGAGRLNRRDDVRGGTSFWRFQNS